MLLPVFDSMLPELRATPRWVVWKGRKVPYSPLASNSKASVSDPGSWSSFSQAQAAYEEGGYLGVGFVLNGDGIVGIDLDACVEAGRPDSSAVRLLENLGCQYVEISPSGAGLRGFGYGERIPGCRGQVDGINLELYAEKRYLTVTGRTLIEGRLAPLRGLSELAARVGRNDLQKSTKDVGSHLLTSSVGGVHPLSSSVGIPSRTLPSRVGERNQCLFEYARFLKAKFPNATREDLRPMVKAWHERALPTIGTKEFAITFADFMHGWERVRQPFGDTMRRIHEGIDHREPLPEWVQRLGYGAQAVQLVRLCMGLQAHHGDSEFFLSARQAGEWIGVHFTDASRMLASLVKDGVLSLVSKGAGKKASRYRIASGRRQ